MRFTLHSTLFGYVSGKWRMNNLNFCIVKTSSIWNVCLKAHKSKERHSYWKDFYFKKKKRQLDFSLSLTLTEAAAIAILVIVEESTPAFCLLGVFSAFAKQELFWIQTVFSGAHIKAINVKLKGKCQPWVIEMIVISDCVLLLVQTHLSPEKENRNLPQQ